MVGQTGSEDVVAEEFGELFGFCTGIWSYCCWSARVDQAVSHAQSSSLLLTMKKNLRSASESVLPRMKLFIKLVRLFVPLKLPESLSVRPPRL